MINCTDVKMANIPDLTQRAKIQPKIGMQVRIRTNSPEFEFAPNSHEFVDPSEFEFATSNSNSPLIRLKSPEA